MLFSNSDSEITDISTSAQHKRLSPPAQPHVPAQSSDSKKKKGKSKKDKSSKKKKFPGRSRSKICSIM